MIALPSPEPLFGRHRGRGGRFGREREAEAGRWAGGEALLSSALRGDRITLGATG